MAFSDVLQELHSSANPVLCVDTCSLLDIVRDPQRQNITALHHEAAIDLLRLAENKRLEVRISQLVRTEYSANNETVCNNTRESIDRFTTSISKVDGIIRLHGQPIFYTPIVTEHWLDHVTRCQYVADRWVQIGQTGPQSSQSIALAGHRINSGGAPSRKGGAGAKDCFIIESYLEFARAVREKGQNAPIVFVSSNVNDYCQDTRSVLAPALQTDFAPVDMRFAPNMAAAKALLGF